MLEKINTPGFESLSTPSPDALEVLRRVLQVQPSASVAEIGVGVGATSIEIVKMMAGKGSLHLFDFNDRVSELAADLRKSEFSNGVSIVEHGNSRKTFDSYAWTLAKMAIAMRDAGLPTQTFDFVYLDGAHSYQYDAPSCVVLKEMIKPGGYLVFDDMYWSFMKSPSTNPANNPDITNHYSDEQLDTPHIEMVVKMFMEPDGRFKQIYLNNNKKPYRPVFQRLTEEPTKVLGAASKPATSHSLQTSQVAMQQAVAAADIWRAIKYAPRDTIRHMRRKLKSLRD